MNKPSKNIINVYDVKTSEKGEFEFDKVFVLLSVNQEKKTMKKCEGVFPFQILNAEIKEEVLAHEMVSHHKKLLYYKTTSEDKVLMTVSNDEEVEKVVTFCKKVQKDLQSQGFTVEN